MRVSPAAANRALRSAALVALAAVAGCTSHVEPPPPSRARVRVRAFTEATPVVHIVAVPPFAFAATGSGIDRWDLRSGGLIYYNAQSTGRGAVNGSGRWEVRGDGSLCAQFNPASPLQPNNARRPDSTS